MRNDELGTVVVHSELLSDRHIEAIQAAVPGTGVVRIDTPEEWQSRRAELGPKVEVAFGLRDIGDLASVPRLRWIQTIGAGMDWLLRAPEIAQSDIVVTNASGVAAVPIAEHVLALMFVLTRRMHRFAQAQRDHEWFQRGRCEEIDGTAMGVIGLGPIGLKTAEKARGLNMRVLGLRRDPSRTSPHVDQMFGPDGLHELLRESDWVVLAAPLTEETRGLLGEPEFRAMKETAYLINIARGQIVQEDVLIQALQEGWISGAGLDVFAQEPLPADSPLWDMRNVMITAHYAGATPRYADRVTGIFTDNLRRYQAGEPLVNVIDKERTYISS